MAKFNLAIGKILQHEGSRYTNHPADRGGPTKHGITLGVLKRYRKGRTTAEDVKKLTVDEAKEIYKAKYWNPIRLSEILMLLIFLSTV